MHTQIMPDKHPKATHNPSEKSLQRWDNEGGAIKGARAKRPRDPAQLAKLMVDIASGKVEDKRQPRRRDTQVVRARSSKRSLKKAK